MSTLAELTPDMAAVKGALFRRLDADATLQGSTYLNGTDKVVTDAKAPATVLPPRLHIETVVCTFDNETMTGRAVVRYRSVLANPSKGVQPDGTRHGRIQQQVGVLVIGKNVFTGTGYQFFDSWIDFTADPMVDPQSPEESYQVSQGVVRFRRV